MRCNERLMVQRRRAQANPVNVWAALAADDRGWNRRHPQSVGAKRLWIVLSARVVNRTKEAKLRHSSSYLGRRPRGANLRTQTAKSSVDTATTAL